MEENQENPMYESENQQSQPSYGSDNNNNFQPQVPLPNATAILVLGIASIVTCFCYGIVGIICGIIAIVMSNTAKTTYESNPAAYTSSSYSNVKTGRICAYIGLGLSAAYIILVIIGLIVGGTMGMFSNPGSMMNM